MAEIQPIQAHAAPQSKRIRRDHVRRTVDVPPELPDVGGIEFRHIESFRGYAIGRDGTVLTCRTKAGHPGFLNRWKRKSPGKWRTSRYLTVSLYRGLGKSVTKKIHHLVLEAFVGQRPSEEHEGRHLDDDPQNNAASNLLWGTAEENAEDAIRNGSTSLRREGTRHPSTKLSDMQVDEIRMSSGSNKEIAAKYGISRQHVSRLKTRKRRL